MNAADRALAQEVAALKAVLATAEAKGLQVAAELAVARAKASEDTALIAQQKLRIAKLERQVYGRRSERSARLIDQLSLTFEELESAATEDELAAEKAVAMTTTVQGFTRKRPERNTFPDHLPRERVVIDPVLCSSRHKNFRALPPIFRGWPILMSSQPCAASAPRSQGKSASSNPASIGSATTWRMSTRR